MIRSVSVKSLAKVNLDLRVLHKRRDGFHELRTVFQTISLADTLEIAYEPARRTELKLEDELNIPDNLVIRAAHAVLESVRVHARVAFRLQKFIPMGAGLGGGSSNAAAVLLALPVLAGRAMPFETMIQVGAGLGSDVPFFLRGGTAVALGRGTEFYRLPDIAEEPILVVSPGLHVPTGPAYQALDQGLTFPEPSSSISSFQAFVWALTERHSAGAASAFSANDFETVVFGQYPQLKTIQRRLRKFGAAGVRMTGSGSAIVAIFRSKAERERARKALEGDRVFRGCRVMPAALVSQRSYERIWRRQLHDHLAPGSHLTDVLWPPLTRYAQ
jgi:4-diphosphocytidyl-2-C-methyl-D-erythritol kinase